VWKLPTQNKHGNLYYLLSTGRLPGNNAHHNNLALFIFFELRNNEIALSTDAKAPLETKNG
jgi:hypothetical protein